VADPEGEETHFFDPEGDSGGDCAAVCGKGSPHYYIMQPLMYSIPFWMRLGQEIRRKNWWNVLKYVSCLLLVFSSGLHSASKEWDTDATDYEWGPWRVIWVMTAIYKTVYCFYWDMVHDFGIWQTGYSGLRDPSTLAFPPYVYYLAMVSERRTPNRSLSLSLSLSCAAADALSCSFSSACDPLCTRPPGL
jgi:hypothetical protein